MSEPVPLKPEPAPIFVTRREWREVIFEVPYESTVAEQLNQMIETHDRKATEGT